jgi:hypothetical protein
MGVLDDAIREHLDLKRRRGAADDEIARAEAEALGPARRSAPPMPEDEPDSDAAETRIVTPVDDVAPPPDLPEPTRALHDIDEDPLAPPAPVVRPHVDDDTAETPPVDAGPAADEPPVDTPRDEDPGGQRRL